MGGCVSVAQEHHDGRNQIKEYAKMIERNRSQADYRWTLEPCLRCGFETTRIAGMKDNEYSQLCDKCEAKERKNAKNARRR